eukprot:SAG11_NODE_3155_length_2644_cov_3.394106_1_plen_62_part_10
MVVVFFSMLSFIEELVKHRVGARSPPFPTTVGCPPVHVLFLYFIVHDLSHIQVFATWQTRLP